MRVMIPTRLLMMLSLLVLAGAAGCQNASIPSWMSPPPPSQRIANARAAYNTGRYRDTFVEAYNATGSGSTAVRDEANYLCGLSAHKLGDLDGAERHLLRAVAGEEQLLAAQSRSELGLIYQEQGRYREAAEQFVAAARSLPTEDQANAYYFAALNQQKLGHHPQARTNFLLAKKLSNDPGLRSSVDTQLAVTGYTLQLGAFASEGNAHAYAESKSQDLINARLGAPRIRRATLGSREFYLVQVGVFSTFESALASKRQIDADRAIVVSIAAR